MKKYFNSLTLVLAAAVLILAIFVQESSPVSAQVAVKPAYACPLVTTYMRMGIDNRQSEVLKLQAFLKQSEGLDVDVNGIFDAKTEQAVKKFQENHRDMILTPWTSAAEPTGKVYVTTAKALNNLACGTPIALNNSDLAIIEAYQAKAVAGTNIATVNQMGPSLSNNAPTPDTTTVSAADAALTTGTDSSDVSAQNDDITMNSSMSDQTANMASVEVATVVQRFWEFLKGLIR